MPDILFIAMENWDEMWRRNQPVAAGFARRHPQNKILFVGLSTDVSHSIRRGHIGALWRALTTRQFTSPRDLPNIYLFNPIKWLPNTLTIGRLINRWSERRQIRAACRRLRIVRPLLWINPYYAIHMLGQMDECAVAYDVGDDWTTLQQKPWFMKLVIKEDEALTRRADVVIVVSERLLDMKQTQAKRLHLIPNGVYLERYVGIAERQLPAHPLTKDWPRPVLAYTGTVHPERVNLDLVADLAKRMPQATVALVGPALLDEQQRKTLEALPNVRLPGPVPFDEVPSLMSGVDVCIVPHQVSDFTESLSPLKLYEYLASGLPIVSTPVSGFRDCPELVHLASDAESFEQAVHAALAENGTLTARRRDSVAPLTWESRMDAIEAALAPVLIVSPRRSSERSEVEIDAGQEVAHAH